MRYSTAPVLFDSSDNHALIEDPANQDWLALLGAIDGDRFDVLARRYYLALSHFRKRRVRPALPGQLEIAAEGKQQALEGMLAVWEQRKAAHKGNAAQAADVFVDAAPPREDDLPEALADLSKTPPPLSLALCGAGRPPCDALCLLRAFLAGPLLGVGDDPTSVFRLLRSNPTFAHHCDFLGRGVGKQPGELTSRRLPSQSVCEEFSEVMTRYGLWQLARIEQVCDNLATGVVELENTVVFDTTHIEAHSHCDNVIAPNAPVEDGKKPKYRKVPRMRKRCNCGRASWDSCDHPWVPTDSGAAVVVKGPSRIYWAHKASVASLSNSEIPIDARVCQVAAQSDGRTLLPHLELLARHFPQLTMGLAFILADLAYQDNQDAVANFDNKPRLIVPVRGRTARAALAERFDGIDRFTPIGAPVCKAGHRFEMRGRDIIAQRYIWAAPDDDAAKPVCASCPLAHSCLGKGQRRHIRVPRKDQPQIDWDHPQHFARDRARYKRRTGVERANKRLKIDLDGQRLTHRDAARVQAHLDRRLLTLHLLLAATTFP